MQPQRSLRISAYSLSGAGAKPVINTSRSPGHPAPRAGGHQRFAALVRWTCARPTAARSSDGRVLVRGRRFRRPRARGRRPRGRRPRPEGAEGAEGATDPPQFISLRLPVSRARSPLRSARCSRPSRPAPRTVWGNHAGVPLPLELCQNARVRPVGDRRSRIGRRNGGYVGTSPVTSRGLERAGAHAR